MTNDTTPLSGGSLLPAAAVTALLVDTMPWVSCDECFERMDSYAESLLAQPDHRDLGMERHLLGCAACDEEAQSLLDLLRTV